MDRPLLLIDDIPVTKRRGHDWRLDRHTVDAGRRGVAAARRALHPEGSTRPEHRRAARLAT